jgi:hypothetical protein
MIYKYLSSTIEEEFIRVNSIGNGAPNKGEPVKDHGWFMGILEE